jgi:hypothetical protein
MIIFTFDQDWAPGWATLRAAKKVLDAGLELTLFVTHECASLETLRSRRGVELGLHPNFMAGSTQGNGPEEIMDNLRSIVPEAVGVRAHGLVRSTRLWELYHRRGLRYDSSDLLEGHPNLQPVTAWNGLVRMPIYWEDDVHLLHDRRCGLDELAPETSGMKCLDFHPMLVALNSCDLRGYRALVKKLAGESRPLHEATEEEVSAFAQTERRGVADLLDEVIEWVDGHPSQRGGALGEVLCGKDG